MNYNIDVSPQFSAQLTQAARAKGIAPAKLLESLIPEFLPPVVSIPVNGGSPAHTTKNSAALAYLRQRIANEATYDAEELVQNLNRNRIESGERPLVP